MEYYLFMGLAMLALSYVAACILVKFAKLGAAEDTEEVKDALYNARTRLEHVLEEEGEKIRDYEITAQISEGKVIFMEISTDNTVGSVEKYGGITEYSLEKKGLSKRGIKTLITAIYFVTMLIFTLVIKASI